MLEELGRNGVLAGGVGAVAGAAVAAALGRWSGGGASAATAALDVVKPQKMAGIVRDATAVGERSVQVASASCKQAAEKRCIGNEAEVGNESRMMYVRAFLLIHSQLPNSKLISKRLSHSTYSDFLKFVLPRGSMYAYSHSRLPGYEITIPNQLF